MSLRLHHEDPDTGCVGELRVAAVTLDRQGFLGRPQWDDLHSGVRPPPDHPHEPGEWAHGWPNNATCASEVFFREAEVLTNSGASIQAHLRSHSGCGSSHIFGGTRPCGARLDSLGRHRAACPCSGRLRSGAPAPDAMPIFAR